jgi:hypothetical protein
MPSYVNVEKHYYNAGSDLPVKPDVSLEIDLSRSFFPPSSSSSSSSSKLCRA